MQGYLNPCDWTDTSLGGPGGSGVELLLTYRTIAGQIFGEQYNFVSFDPRGVNNSGPRASTASRGMQKQDWLSVDCTVQELPISHQHRLRNSTIQALSTESGAMMPSRKSHLMDIM